MGGAEGERRGTKETEGSWWEVREIGCCGRKAGRLYCSVRGYWKGLENMESNGAKYWCL